MKEQHILFIHMPTLPLSDLIKGTTNRGVRCFPFGILYLSAVLKKQEHPGHIACVDYLIQDSAKFATNLDELITSEAVNAISPYIPDILAFSFSYSTQYDFFCRCLPLFKKIWPDAIVIAGGIHTSNAVEYLLENHDVDYVVAGEGEESFPLLLSSLRNQEKKLDIQGVHSRDAIHYDITGKPEIATPIENINDLPLPDWSILKIESYVGQDVEGTQAFWDEIEVKGQHRHAFLFTTRGCPFKCTFCSSHSIHDRKMRQRDVENVVEEMRQLNKSYGSNYFHIYDDLAFVTTKRALELLRAMKNSGIENLKISVSQALSVNCTSEETIDAFIDYTGSSIITFSVETGNPEMQKRIKKNVDLNRAERLIRYAQSKGLIVIINIILGFPEETKEKILKSISYVKKHLRPNWTHFLIATPVIGSEMYDQFIGAGCITNSPKTWNKTLINYRYFDSHWITADELNELCYRANLECNFADNYDLQRGDYNKSLLVFRSIIKLYPFHIFAWDGIRRAERLLGNEKEAHVAEQKIRELVVSDSRSRELLEKYGDLFPEVIEICRASLKRPERLAEQRGRKVTMEIKETIDLLESLIKNPSEGLPEDIFLFVSRLTPIVNVDLLIKDENGRTLLSWRDDSFVAAGWHLPGGIVRFKEKLEIRIQKVAKKEIGAIVKFDPVPMAINQIICKHNTRGHFISVLYKCFLSSEYIPKNIGLSNKDTGYLMWHDSCPENLLKVHEIYRKYI